ncbi:MAG: flagellar hook-length control protein FliK [Defluviitaleaceae bacterium]|nr:flagellar hook-length control protein FliK [Defluviitaleaceae bacterium]
MVLNGIFQSEAPPLGEAASAKKPKSGETSFEAFLASIERSGQKKEDPKQTAKPKQAEPKPKLVKNRAEAPEPRESTIRAEIATAEAVRPIENQALENPAAAPEAIPEAIKEAEGELVSRIAEILGIPVETVLEWFIDLGFNPLEATEPQVVVEILKQAFGSQTTAELLTEPQLPEAFEKLMEAAKEIVEALPIVAAEKTESMVLPELRGLQVETSGPNAPPVVTEVRETDAQKEEFVSFFYEESEETEGVSVSAPQQKPTAQPNAAPEAKPEEAAPAAQTESGRNDALYVEREIEFIPVVQVSAEGGASLAQTAVESQPSQPGQVNANDIINQIMSRVKLQAGEHFAELRLTLKPENLGDVTLRVMTLNGIVTAQFVAESQRVKEALESNFNQLKNALSEQGVNVAELSVSVGKDDPEERMNQFLRAQAASRARMRRIAEASVKNEIGEDERAAPNLSTSRLDVTA